MAKGVWGRTQSSQPSNHKSVTYFSVEPSLILRFFERIAAPLWFCNWKLIVVAWTHCKIQLCKIRQDHLGKIICAIVDVVHMEQHPCLHAIHIHSCDFAYAHANATFVQEGRKDRTIRDLAKCNVYAEITFERKCFLLQVCYYEWWIFWCTTRLENHIHE